MYSAKDANAARTARALRTQPTNTAALFTEYFLVCRAFSDTPVARETHQQYVAQVESLRQLLRNQTLRNTQPVKRDLSESASRARRQGASSSSTSAGPSPPPPPASPSNAATGPFSRQGGQSPITNGLAPGASTPVQLQQQQADSGSGPAFLKPSEGGRQPSVTPPLTLPLRGIGNCSPPPPSQQQAAAVQAAVQAAVLADQRAAENYKTTPSSYTILRNEWGEEYYEEMCYKPWNAYLDTLADIMVNTVTVWVSDNERYTDVFNSLVRYSSTCCYDTAHGMCLLRWNSAKEVRNYVDSLHAVVNAPLSKFFTPLALGMEVLGVPVLCLSLAPVTAPWVGWDSIYPVWHSFEALCASLHLFKPLSRTEGGRGEDPRFAAAFAMAKARGALAPLDQAAALVAQASSAGVANLNTPMYSTAGLSASGTVTTSGGGLGTNALSSHFTQPGSVNFTALMGSPRSHGMRVSASPHSVFYAVPGSTCPSAKRTGGAGVAATHTSLDMFASKAALSANGIAGTTPGAMGGGVGTVGLGAGGTASGAAGGSNARDPSGSNAVNEAARLLLSIGADARWYMLDARAIALYQPFARHSHTGLCMPRREMYHTRDGCVSREFGPNELVLQSKIKIVVARLLDGTKADKSVLLSSIIHGHGIRFGTHVDAILDALKVEHKSLLQQVQDAQRHGSASPNNLARLHQCSRCIKGILAELIARVVKHLVRQEWHAYTRDGTWWLTKFQNYCLLASSSRASVAVSDHSSTVADPGSTFHVGLEAANTTTAAASSRAGGADGVGAPTLTREEAERLRAELSEPFLQTLQRVLNGVFFVEAEPDSPNDENLDDLAEQSGSGNMAEDGGLRNGVLSNDGSVLRTGGTGSRRRMVGNRPGSVLAETSANLDEGESVNVDAPPLLSNGHFGVSGGGPGSATRSRTSSSGRGLFASQYTTLKESTPAAAGNGHYPAFNPSLTGVKFRPGMFDELRRAVYDGFYSKAYALGEKATESQVLHKQHTVMRRSRRGGVASVSAATPRAPGMPGVSTATAAASFFDAQLRSGVAQTGAAGTAVGGSGGTTAGSRHRATLPSRSAMYNGETMHLFPSVRLHDMNSWLVHGEASPSAAGDPELYEFQPEHIFAGFTLQCLQEMLNIPLLVGDDGIEVDRRVSTANVFDTFFSLAGDVPRPSETTDASAHGATTAASLTSATSRTPLRTAVWRNTIEVPLFLKQGSREKIRVYAEDQKQLGARVVLLPQQRNAHITAAAAGGAATGSSREDSEECRLHYLHMGKNIQLYATDIRVALRGWYNGEDFDFLNVDDYSVYGGANMGSGRGGGGSRRGAYLAAGVPGNLTPAGLLGVGRNTQRASSRRDHQGRHGSVAGSGSAAADRLARRAGVDLISDGARPRSAFAADASMRVCMLCSKCDATQALVAHWDYAQRMEELFEGSTALGYILRVRVQLLARIAENFTSPRITDALESAVDKLDVLTGGIINFVTASTSLPSTAAALSGVFPLPTNTGPFPSCAPFPPPPGQAKAVGDGSSPEALDVASAGAHVRTASEQTPSPLDSASGRFPYHAPGATIATAANPPPPLEPLAHHHSKPKGDDNEGNTNNALTTSGWMSSASRDRGSSTEREQPQSGGNGRPRGEGLAVGLTRASPGNPNTSGGLYKIGNDASSYDGTNRGMTSVAVHVAASGGGAAGMARGSLTAVKPFELRLVQCAELYFTLLKLLVKHMLVVTPDRAPREGLDRAITSASLRRELIVLCFGEQSVEAATAANDLGLLFMRSYGTFYQAREEFLRAKKTISLHLARAREAAAAERAESELLAGRVTALDFDLGSLEEIDTGVRKGDDKVVDEERSPLSPLDGEPATNTVPHPAEKTNSKAEEKGGRTTEAQRGPGHRREGERDGGKVSEVAKGLSSPTPPPRLKGRPPSPPSSGYTGKRPPTPKLLFLHRGKGNNNGRTDSATDENQDMNSGVVGTSGRPRGESTGEGGEETGRRRQGGRAHRQQRPTSPGPLDDSLSALSDVSASSSAHSGNEGLLSQPSSVVALPSTSPEVNENTPLALREMKKEKEGKTAGTGQMLVNEDGDREKEIGLADAPPRVRRKPALLLAAASSSLGKDLPDQGHMVPSAVAPPAQIGNHSPNVAREVSRPLGSSSRISEEGSSSVSHLSYHREPVPPRAEDEQRSTHMQRTRRPQRGLPSSSTLRRRVGSGSGSSQTHSSTFLNTAATSYSALRWWVGRRNQAVRIAFGPYRTQTSVATTAVLQSGLLSNTTALVSALAGAAALFPSSLSTTTGVGAAALTGLSSATTTADRLAKTLCAVQNNLALLYCKQAQHEYRTCRNVLLDAIQLARQRKVIAQPSMGERLRVKMQEYHRRVESHLDNAMTELSFVLDNRNDVPAVDYATALNNQACALAFRRRYGEARAVLLQSLALTAKLLAARRVTAVGGASSPAAAVASAANARLLQSFEGVTPQQVLTSSAGVAAPTVYTSRRVSGSPLPTPRRGSDSATYSSNANANVAYPVVTSTVPHGNAAADYSNAVFPLAGLTGSMGGGSPGVFRDGGDGGGDWSVWDELWMEATTLQAATGRWIDLTCGDTVDLNEGYAPPSTLPTPRESLGAVVLGEPGEAIPGARPGSYRLFGNGTTGSLIGNANGGDGSAVPDGASLGVGMNAGSGFGVGGGELTNDRMTWTTNNPSRHAKSNHGSMGGEGSVWESIVPHSNFNGPSFTTGEGAGLAMISSRAGSSVISPSSSSLSGPQLWQCHINARVMLHQVEKNKAFLDSLRIQRIFDAYLSRWRERRARRRAEAAALLHRVVAGACVRVHLARHYRYSGYYFWMRQPQYFAAHLPPHQQSLRLREQSMLWSHQVQNATLRLQRTMRAARVRQLLGQQYQFIHFYEHRCRPAVEANILARMLQVYEVGMLQCQVVRGLLALKETAEGLASGALFRETEQNRLLDAETAARHSIEREEVGAAETFTRARLWNHEYVDRTYISNCGRRERREMAMRDGAASQSTPTALPWGPPTAASGQVSPYPSNSPATHTIVAVGSGGGFDRSLGSTLNSAAATANSLDGIAMPEPELPAPAFPRGSQAPHGHDPLTVDRLGHQSPSGVGAPREKSVPVPLTVVEASGSYGGSAGKAGGAGNGNGATAGQMWMSPLFGLSLTSPVERRGLVGSYRATNTANMGRPGASSPLPAPNSRRRNRPVTVRIEDGAGNALTSAVAVEREARFRQKQRQDLECWPTEHDSKDDAHNKTVTPPAALAYHGDGGNGGPAMGGADQSLTAPLGGEKRVGVGFSQAAMAAAAQRHHDRQTSGVGVGTPTGSHLGVVSAPPLQSEQARPPLTAVVGNGTFLSSPDSFLDAVRASVAPFPRGNHRAGGAAGTPQIHPAGSGDGTDYHARALSGASDSAFLPAAVVTEADRGKKSEVAGSDLTQATAPPPPPPPTERVPVSPPSLETAAATQLWKFFLHKRAIPLQAEAFLAMHRLYGEYLLPIAEASVQRHAWQLQLRMLLAEEAAGRDALVMSEVTASMALLLLQTHANKFSRQLERHRRWGRKTAKEARAYYNEVRAIEEAEAAEAARVYVYNQQLLLQQQAQQNAQPAVLETDATPSPQKSAVASTRVPTDTEGSPQLHHFSSRVPSSNRPTPPPSGHAFPVEREADSLVRKRWSYEVPSQPPPLPPSSHPFHNGPPVMALDATALGSISGRESGDRNSFSVPTPKHDEATTPGASTRMANKNAVSSSSGGTVAQKRPPYDTPLPPPSLTFAGKPVADAPSRPLHPYANTGGAPEQGDTVGVDSRENRGQPPVFTSPHPFSRDHERARAHSLTPQPPSAPSHLFSTPQPVPPPPPLRRPETAGNTPSAVEGRRAISFLAQDQPYAV